MKVPRCMACGKKAVFMLSGYGCQCFCEKCQQEVERGFEERPEYLKEGASRLHFIHDRIVPEWERIPPSGGMLVEFWLSGREGLALRRRARSVWVGPHRYAKGEVECALYRGLSGDVISKLQEPESAV